MPQTTIILNNQRNLDYCKTMLSELPLDGTKTITFADTDETSTARQRRLQWMWNGEVAKSGLGADDDKDSVHVRAKWMFARPIMLRDDEYFPTLCNAFLDAVKLSETRPADIRWFTERHISTETMTRKQRAEYLTEFQRYWTGKGVNLTDPSLQGIDLNIY